MTYLIIYGVCAVFSFGFLFYLEDQHPNASIGLAIIGSILWPLVLIGSFGFKVAQWLDHS